MPQRKTVKNLDTFRGQEIHYKIALKLIYLKSIHQIHGRCHIHVPSFLGPRENIPLSHVFQIFTRESQPPCPFPTKDIIKATLYL